MKDVNLDYVRMITKFYFGTTVKCGSSVVKVVENFCYLASYLSSNSSCDKDCLTTIGKVNSVFGRLKAVWKNKYISFRVKVSFVMSILLYSAELWPLTISQKKLEAALHRFQRRLLGITRRDKIGPM